MFQFFIILVASFTVIIFSCFISGFDAFEAEQTSLPDDKQEKSPSASSATTTTTSYLARINSYDLLLGRVFSHKKPSLLLFYDPDVHSSIVDVLWAQLAKNFRTVIDICSFDVTEIKHNARVRNFPTMFGVTELPAIRVQFATKMLRKGGDGLFVLDLASFSPTELKAINGTIQRPGDEGEIRRNYDLEIARTEEECETEDDLLQTKVAKDFFNDMEKYARRVLLRASRVVENVRTLKELQDISWSRLNRLVTVLFLEGDKSEMSTTTTAQKTPLGFLLASSTPSQSDTIAFVTVFKKSPLGKYLLETAIPSIASQISNKNDLSSNIWVFSRAFLTQNEDPKAAAICRTDDGHRLNNDSYVSFDDMIDFIRNNTYVENVIDQNCVAKPFPIPTSGEDFDPSFQAHVDFDQLCSFLDYDSRPPPSLHTPVPECRSFLECARNHPETPFIVRNTTEFNDMDLTYERAVDLAHNAPSDSNKIKGALPSGDKIELSVPDAMAMWLNDTLVGNYLYITPQTRTNWFPMPQVTIDEDKDPENSHRTLIFTYPRAYTGLHADPGVEGGSWMHLFSGRKLWQFFHPRHHVYFVGDLLDGQPSVIDSSIVETFSCLAGAGDTVYFPPAFLHRVWTFEKSFGLNSYLTPKKLSDKDIKDWIQFQFAGAIAKNRIN